MIIAENQPFCYTCGMKNNPIQEGGTRRRRLRNILIRTAFILPLAAAAHAQTEIILESDAGSVKVYTLENSLTVFVREDPASALASVTLCVRAGFSAQDMDTAGFFPLYTNLFAHGESGITRECNAESATYTANVPPEYFPEYMQRLAEWTMHPSFTDAALSKEYEAAKKSAEEYAASTAGFINSAIDSRMFPHFPWKQESGIYPALFASLTVPDVRTVLSGIRSAFYVPENSAIFVTGNISAEEVHAEAERWFSAWRQASVRDESAWHSSQEKSRQPEKEEQRKFVIVSPYFSGDMTQLVVQFTSLPDAECDILSAAFNMHGSPYKAGALAEGSLGLRGKDYLSAVSVHDANGTRLILQALLEAPYSFSQVPQKEDDAEVTGAEQAETFVRTVKDAALLSRRNFVAAQQEVTAKYRSETGNPVRSMEILASMWARERALPANALGGRLLDEAHSADFVTEERIHEHIKNEEPYIFALVNRTVYEQSMSHFLDGGFAVITEENASWHADQMLSLKARAKSESRAQKKNEQDDDGLYDGETLRHAKNFYRQNQGRILSYTLKNGIPLTVKQVPGSQTVTLSLAIAGGEAASPDGERALRTVLVNAFARSIQAEVMRLREQNGFSASASIKAWTEETVSYITLTCMAQDLESALNALTGAVIYADITPGAADSLVSEQVYQHGTISAPMTRQLRNAALTYIYQGTPYANIWDESRPILQRTTFQSIQLSYTRLLDASLYSLVIAGDCDSEKAFQMAENSFALLKEQSLRKDGTAKSKVPAPVFKSRTRTAQIRHTYTTDMDASSAGTEPPVLVPTKDFFDPAQFYFRAPDTAAEREIFNALILELAERMRSILGDRLNCVAETAGFQIPLGMIQAENLPRTSVFSDAYGKAFSSLSADLRQEADGAGEHGVSVTRAIKNKWEERNLVLSQTNEGTAALIQRGLLEFNPLQYLDDYLAVESADANDFLRILSESIGEEPALRMLSADSKK